MCLMQFKQINRTNGAIIFFTTKFSTLLEPKKMLISLIRKREVRVCSMKHSLQLYKAQPWKLPKRPPTDKF